MSDRTMADDRELREIAAGLHWMARRYADGRMSYAASSFNAWTRRLLAMGVELNPTGDGTVWARDGMGRAFDGLTDEEAAQGREPDGIYTDSTVEQLRAELERSQRETAALLLAANQAIAGLADLVCVHGATFDSNEYPDWDSHCPACAALRPLVVALKQKDDGFE